MSVKRTSGKVYMSDHDSSSNSSPAGLEKLIKVSLERLRISPRHVRSASELGCYSPHSPILINDPILPQQRWKDLIVKKLRQLVRLELQKTGGFASKQKSKIVKATLSRFLETGMITMHLDSRFSDALKKHIIFLDLISSFRGIQDPRVFALKLSTLSRNDRTLIHQIIGDNEGLHRLYAFQDKSNISEWKKIIKEEIILFNQLYFFEREISSEKSINLSTVRIHRLIEDNFRSFVSLNGGKSPIFFNEIRVPLSRDKKTIIEDFIFFLSEQELTDRVEISPKRQAEMVNYSDSDDKGYPGITTSLVPSLNLLRSLYVFGSSWIEASSLIKEHLSPFFLTGFKLDFPYLQYDGGGSRYHISFDSETKNFSTDHYRTYKLLAKHKNKDKHGNITYPIELIGKVKFVIRIDGNLDTDQAKVRLKLQGFEFSDSIPSQKRIKLSKSFNEIFYAAKKGDSIDRRVLAKKILRYAHVEAQKSLKEISQFSEKDPAKEFDAFIRHVTKSLKSLDISIDKFEIQERKFIREYGIDRVLIGMIKKQYIKSFLIAMHRSKKKSISFLQKNNLSSTIAVAMKFSRSKLEGQITQLQNTLKFSALVSPKDQSDMLLTRYLQDNPLKLQKKVPLLFLLKMIGADFNDILKGQFADDVHMDYLKGFLDIDAYLSPVASSKHRITTHDKQSFNVIKKMKYRFVSSGEDSRTYATIIFDLSMTMELTGEVKSASYRLNNIKFSRSIPLDEQLVCLGFKSKKMV